MSGGAVAGKLGFAGSSYDTGSGTIDGRPVDLVHLSKYTLGDRSLEGELLSLFRTQAVIYLEKLERTDCAKEWVDMAHSLKGSAKGIGAWALADIAEDAERMETPQAAGRQEALSQLRRSIDLVGLFIDDILRD